VDDNSDRICIATFFIDIKRENWTNQFSRSNKTYLDSFLPHLQLTEELIVFIDPSSGFDIQKELRDVVPQNLKITVIEITEEILSKIKSWNYIETEDKIMNSDYFKNLIPHRIGYPEVSMSKYNIVQHCKTDFIRYVIDNKLTNANYIAWSDFGYFGNLDKLPTKALDIDKIGKDKINYCTVNDVNFDNHKNIIDELKFPTEIIAGSFFIGHRDTHIKYNNLYHSILTEDFYDNNIVDDDQHVVLRCYLRCPDLFQFHLTGWHNAYIHFQK